MNMKTVIKETEVIIAFYNLFSIRHFNDNCFVDEVVIQQN